jgi:hypothetical protein
MECGDIRKSGSHGSTFADGRHGIDALKVLANLSSAKTGQACSGLGIASKETLWATLRVEKSGQSSVHWQAVLVRLSMDSMQLNRFRSLVH